MFRKPSRLHFCGLDLRASPLLDSLSLTCNPASSCAATEDRRPKARVLECPPQPLLSSSSLECPRKQGVVVHFPVCNAELTTTVEFPSQAKTPLASLREIADAADKPSTRTRARTKANHHPLLLLPKPANSSARRRKRGVAEHHTPTKG